jgi:MFS family permease
MGTFANQAESSPSAMTGKQPHGAGLNRVLFLLAISVLINYIDRSNLSIAAPLIKDEIGLSALQLGKLLSAFFWAYALMQIPAGWLVDRFDVKWVFSLGFLLWSASTAFTGLLHGFAALLLIRVAVGVGESIAYPSYCKILAEHFSDGRKGLANGVIASGAALGPAIGLIIGGSVVARFGWRPFFLTVGLGSWLWLIPWVSWMPSQTDSEAARLRQPIGIVDLLSRRAMWGSSIGLFCNNYSLYFVVTWLPFYLVRGRGFSLTRMSHVAALMFLVFAASATAWGKLSDQWIKAGASSTFVRKGMMVVGNCGFGLLLAASVLVPEFALVWALCLAGVFLGMSNSNLWAITQILAGPRIAGRWVGVQNFLGNLAGGIGPTLAGFLIDRTGGYRWAFFVVSGIAGIGALNWAVVLGPVEQVEWKRVSPALEISA